MLTSVFGEPAGRTASRDRLKSPSPYGFPRSRFGLAWEPLFIQARSASKGIRSAGAFRAEHDDTMPICRARSALGPAVEHGPRAHGPLPATHGPGRGDHSRVEQIGDQVSVGGVPRQL